jgi:thiol-disulfide isomerase/thioredoxin
MKLREKFFFSLFVFLLFFSSLSAQETKPASSLTEMPEFVGIEGWLNSPPLTKASLKGKVVLVDFWTYTCVNCLRTLPYLKNWYAKYKDKGLVIVGVHSPEFEFEKEPANVKKAVEKYQIPYPIALDGKMATWTAYRNEAWPAHYFIDGSGRIRHVHLGEGEYAESEEWIKNLLSELKPDKKTVTPSTQPTATILPDTDFSQIKSPETYLGYLRQERRVTSGRSLDLNEWATEGKWRTEGERIVLTEGSGTIRFRFNANKVNLVMHPGAVPSQAIIRLDGQTVSKDKAGKDVVNGNLLINEPRMYELINLGSKGEEHTVEIEFLTPGVAAYAFTFG